MAIYRKGEASLAADGTVTGYGTNWKDQLALVRIGATVVFLNGNAIGAIGTVSAIVSETQLQTIQTDGAVVARGKYFILLHDSLTVDGLAQNVAETLRYYQSQETEIAEAMDYFKTFDWEKFESIAKGVKTNAEAAKVSETNAKASEANAKQSENASSSSKNAAAASQAAAKTSETNAKASETNAKASENAAAGSKAAAAGSATDAAASKTAAAASQVAAKTSETNSKSSETNAKSSENSALQSKNAAAGSAAAAKTSETNAKSSETKAKTSETNSAGSAATATSEADRAKREADRAAAANPDNSLLKANNLSDVPDKAKARNNLGLGNSSTRDVDNQLAPTGSYFNGAAVMAQIHSDYRNLGGYDRISNYPLGMTFGIQLGGNSWGGGSGVDTYTGMLTLRGWHDTSGGGYVSWQLASTSQGLKYRQGNGAIQGFSNEGFTQAHTIYSTQNTTKTSDGTIKTASPIVKIFSDGSFETNQESEGCTVRRIKDGEYLVEGCMGMNSDAAWGGIDGGFDLPKDRNGQSLIWLDYDVNPDGSVLVKTFHREYPLAPEFARNHIEGVVDGDPVDVPEYQFVSVRVNMPNNTKCIGFDDLLTVN
ncbi:tail fiber protein [Enterobacter phage Phc]|nr:tail fiber protein [Enterobacter phage Phc]